MSDAILNESTVEEALKELREMFPPPMGSFQVSLYVQGGEDQWRVSGRALPYIGGSTIGECMAQVRKWKQEQS